MTEPMNAQEAVMTNTEVPSQPTPVVAQDASLQECAEFQALMSKRISEGEDLQTYPHMLTCERCRGLVRDLEAIATAAKDYFALEQEPSDELWGKIQLAIEHGEA